MVLTFPYYDPNGRYNHAFQRQLKTLQSAFDMVCVSVAPPTGRDNGGFVHYLEAQGCAVFDNPIGATIGDQSREALRLALQHAQAQQPIFFGFLDRILFALETEWRWQFLQDLKVYHTAEFLVFERSQAAWGTHPANYREIEQMVSRMFELLCGRPIELMPCALLLSHNTASSILGQSTSPSHEVWAEWALLAMKNGIPITTRKVDWLAWEHPYWEGIDPDELKHRQEASTDEVIKRIKMNVPVALMLTEERFRNLAPS
ncbi:MAG: hypothetical protein JXA14_09145 [Anaerolineae bacterium]|nr:hypothetical protein [Anaerolineae bacterium]